MGERETIANALCYLESNLSVFLCLFCFVKVAKNLFSVVFLGNITVLAMYNNPSIRLYVVGANNYSPLRVQLTITLRSLRLRSGTEFSGTSVAGNKKERLEKAALFYRFQSSIKFRKES